MQRPKILALVGGISKNSINQQLFDFFRKQAGERFEFDQFAISALPYFSQDIEEDPPASARDFKARVKNCDGLLFVTPEYNRSFPGVLKNALDWGSRPPGQNLWAGKPAGVIGTTPGAIGTFGAQNHLRQVLSFLDIRAMHQPEFYFTFPKQLENGNLPERSVQFLEHYIKAFADWVACRK